jgi:uncharacterized alkaline shock family protein YloU
MALEPTDPLDRAVEVARDEPTPETWEQVSTSVMGKVRNLVRPSEPLVVHTAGGSTEQDDSGSETIVQSRVLVTALRRLFAAHPTLALADVRLDVEERHLREAELDVVAAYGVSIPEVAEQARQDVLETVRQYLGPDPAFTAASIAISVDDVVEDPSELH